MNAISRSTVPSPSPCPDAGRPWPHDHHGYCVGLSTLPLIFALADQNGWQPWNLVVWFWVDGSWVGSRAWASATAGPSSTARARLECLHPRGQLSLLSFFAILEAWFMDLNFCFQGGLAHSWYHPFSCHVHVGSTVVLKAQGAFHWISHFLSHWSRKLALGWGVEEGFKLLLWRTGTVGVILYRQLFSGLWGVTMGS